MNQNKLDLSKPFYLNQFLIDPVKGEVLDKNQVKFPETENDSLEAETTSLEPKVMQVLLLLVNRSGELISQEDIFTSVWPKSIFNPSSIQRCIALLRKIFNDDAKQQAIIKTHPKRGYSLHAELRNTVSEGLPRQSTKFKMLTVALSITFIVIAFSIFLEPKKTIQFEDFELAPLSSTESNEYQAQYSPDLKYVAYLHEDSNSSSQIWLRNNQTEEHIPLTDNNSLKLAIAWSYDSSALIYTEKSLNAKPPNANPTNANSTNEQQHNKNDSEIGMVNVTIKRISLPSDEKFGSVSLPTPVIIEQLNSVFFMSNIHWSADNHLYYIEEDSLGSLIYKHNLATGQKKPLSLPLSQMITNASIPYYLSLSKNGEKLAVLVKSENEQNHIVILNNRGKLLETRTLTSTKALEVSWHPDEETLLINNGSQLSLLGKDNNVSRINYVSRSKIVDSHFVNSTLINFTLDRVDADIFEYDLNVPSIPAKIIINSNQVDSSAKLSPSGKKIAFVSQRAKYPQLFLRENNRDILLYRNIERHPAISDALWLNDSLLFVSINGVLTQFDLTQETQLSFPADVQIRHLLDWDPIRSSILLEYSESESRKIGYYNIDEKTLELVYQLQTFQAAHAIAENKLVLIEFNKFFELDSNGKGNLLYETKADNIDMSTNTSSGIYFQTKTGQRYELWHMSYPDIKVKKLFSIPHNQILVDISSNETKALFRDLTHEKDIVVLEKKLP